MQDKAQSLPIRDDDIIPTAEGTIAEVLQKAVGYFNDIKEQDKVNHLHILVVADRIQLPACEPHREVDSLVMKFPTALADTAVRKSNAVHGVAPLLGVAAAFSQAVDINNLCARNMAEAIAAVAAIPGVDPNVAAAMNRLSSSLRQQGDTFENTKHVLALVNEAALAVITNTSRHAAALGGSRPQGAVFGAGARQAPRPPAPGQPRMSSQQPAAPPAAQTFAQPRPSPHTPASTSAAASQSSTLWLPVPLMQREYIEDEV